MQLDLSAPSKFEAFPYAKPYDIQDDLMRHLYSAIEARSVTIIESPTGTGKTLSLLCAALTWLLDDQARARKGELNVASGSAGSQPSWVLAQTVERKRRALEEADEAYEERLRKARKKEDLLKRMAAKARKKTKHDSAPKTEAESDDEQFLPEEETQDKDDSNISPAVRALMAKYYKPSTTETEDEPICTKIFYASRTHSQLTQVLPEMRRLRIQPHDNAASSVASPCAAGTKRGASDALDSETQGKILRAVALGSRKQLCINDDLRKRTSDLDEACRTLLHEKGDKRCPYLPPIEENEKMHELRDQILATPKDIEELAELGRTAETCPYFGSRSAIAQAQLVTLPYNLLLQKNAREALGIDLKDQVLVIDEAHNIIPTLLSLSSCTLPLSTLATSLQQLSTYHSRFRTRLTSTHSLHLRRLVTLLKELHTYACSWLTSTSKTQRVGHAEVMTVGELMSRLGKNVDGINLLEIGDYLKKSKLARKINGYAEKAALKAQGGKAKANANTNPPLHAVEAFLISLSSANEDGRISLTLLNDSKLEIKFQLLNPATHFREVLDEARSVILAGGTMSPMSDYTAQLFSHLPKARLSTFSCGHIIPHQNLSAVVLSRGPSGKELEFKYSTRGDESLLSELGQLVMNLGGIVPKGMIVFVPSYAFLDELVKVWKRSGAWERIGGKKKIFMEPRDTDVESVMREYAAVIHQLPAGTSSIKSGKTGVGNGALLLAVVGAKLSEGLNFTDDLARAVLVVGIPFPNAKSAELQERMKYVSRTMPSSQEDLKNAGRDAAAELYENIAMNAVNQSIGRAIRHGSDWAGLILVDKRYGNARIRAKLPKWIGESISAPETFGGAMKTLGAFYRGRRPTS